MQTVAALPTPVSPMPLAAAAAPEASAALDADGSSDGLGSFARLLLGRLSEGIEKITGDKLQLAVEDGDDADTDTDPLLLLAAMGLVLDPENLPAKPAAEQGDAPLDDGDDKIALLNKAFTQEEDADDEPHDLKNFTKTLASGKEDKPALQVAADPKVAAAANLAGFDAKLADATASHAGSETPNTLHAGGIQSSAPRPIGDSAQQHLATPVRSPAWPAEFAQKILWVATHGRQSAQMTLNPSHMGPIEISLSVRHDQATAVFVSGNAEVREAIEAAMPRLREMLAGAGIELGQANVSAESFRQAEEGSQSGNGQRSGGGDGGGDATAEAGGALNEVSSRQGAIKSGNGLVDTFV